MKSKTTSILVSLLIVLVIALIVGVLYYFGEKQNVLEKILKEQKETSTKIEKKDNPTTDTDFSCPTYVPPSPGWCANGTIVSSPKDINGCNVPPICLPKQDENFSLDRGLEIAFQNHKNGQISECTLNGNIYYSAMDNIYDGGGKTYDTNGNIVGTLGWWPGGTTGIQPQNCEKIYAVFPNIWGYPPINKYNLK